MLKSIVTSVLILTFSMAVTACRSGSEYGVLVAKFDDGAQLFKAKIFLPAVEDRYQFNFELRQGKLVCSLTGQRKEKELVVADRCEGIKGEGKISCNDGYAQRLRWLQTSCLGGHGRSIGKKGRHFYFGFDHNKERALDQLAKAQQAN